MIFFRLINFLLATFGLKFTCAYPLVGYITVPLMVDYFRDVRGAVKGKGNEMCGEGVVICVGAVMNLADRVPCALMCVDRITLRGRFLFNLAETRDFYSAAFFSGFGSSAESVVLTRATHSRAKIMANVGLASRGFFSVHTQSGQVNLRSQSSMSGSTILAGRQRGHRIGN